MTPKSSPAIPLRQLPPVQASTPAVPVASNREPTATGAAELPPHLSFVRDYDREKTAQQAARLAEFRMHHDRPFHLAPRAPFATFIDMLLNRQRRASEVQADYDDEQELVGR